MKSVRIETQSRLLKVTFAVQVEISPKRCNVETLLLQTTCIDDLYSDLHGQSRVASLFNCNFSHSSTAAETILTDVHQNRLSGFGAVGSKFALCHPVGQISGKTVKFRLPQLRNRLTDFGEIRTSELPRAKFHFDPTTWVVWVNIQHD